jgi:hypothetical protein
MEENNARNEITPPITETKAEPMNDTASSVGIQTEEREKFP